MLTANSKPLYVHGRLGLIGLPTYHGYCSAYVQPPRKSVGCPQPRPSSGNLSSFRGKWLKHPRLALSSSGRSWPQHVLRSRDSLAHMQRRRVVLLQQRFKLPSSCMSVEGGAGTPLAAPYVGPYEVVSSGPKFFSLKVGDRVETVSVDRLKPHQGQHPPVVAEAAKRGRPRKVPPAVVSLVASS